MFTRNARLNQALKIKENALGIFHSAKEQLDVAIQKLQEHIGESEALIGNKLKEVDEEREMIKRNRMHIESSRRTIVKINEIVS
jgi:peptidoglycan hydrolase CwlO-like protein